MKNLKFINWIAISIISLYIVACKKKENPVIAMPTIPTNTVTPTPTPTVSAGVTWSTLFFDDFNRADGLLGSNYTTQVGCQNHTGKDTLLNNEIKFGGQGCWAILYNTAVTNSIVRSTVNYKITSGTPALGMTLKGTDLGNNWMYQEYYGFSADNTNGIVITKYLSDASHPPASSPLVETLASKAFTLQQNHVYKFTFQIINSNLAAYIEDLNGTAKDSIKGVDTGTLYTGSTVRLNGYNAGVSDTLTIDDFKIETGN